jgi:hypothetical protein
MELPDGKGTANLRVWQEIVNGVTGWYVDLEDEAGNRLDTGDMSSEDIASAAAGALLRETDTGRFRAGLIIDHNPLLNKKISLWKGNEKVVSWAAVAALMKAAASDPVRAVGSMIEEKQDYAVSRSRVTIIDVGKIRISVNKAKDEAIARLADYLKIENGTILLHSDNFTGANGKFSDRSLEALKKITGLAHSDRRGMKVYFRYMVNGPADLNEIAQTLAAAGVDNVYFDFSKVAMHKDTVREMLEKIGGNTPVTVRLHDIVDDMFEKETKDGKNAKESIVVGNGNMKFVREIMLQENMQASAITEMMNNLKPYEVAEIAFHTSRYGLKTDKITMQQLEALAASPVSNPVILPLEQLKEVVERQRNITDDYYLMDLLRRLHVTLETDRNRQEKKMAAVVNRQYLPSGKREALVNAVREFETVPVAARLAALAGEIGEATHVAAHLINLAQELEDAQKEKDDEKARKVAEAAGEYLKGIAARSLAKDILDSDLAGTLGLEDESSETLLGKVELQTALYGEAPDAEEAGTETREAQLLQGKLARAKTVVNRYKTGIANPDMDEVEQLIGEFRKEIEEIEKDPAARIPRTSRQTAALSGLRTLLPLLERRFPVQEVREEKTFNPGTVAAIMRAA